MTLLQIITDPDNWDNSRLQVVGKTDPITGRTLNPTATLIIARDLPEPHLTTWRDTVESLRSEGQGDWDIVQVDVQEIAQLVEQELNDKGEYDYPEYDYSLYATLHRQYTDGTCDSFDAIWEKQDLLDLFRYLTTN